MMLVNLLNKKGKFQFSIECPFEFGDKPDTHPDIIKVQGENYYRYVTADATPTYRIAVIYDIGILPEGTRVEVSCGDPEKTGHIYGSVEVLRKYANGNLSHYGVRIEADHKLWFVHPHLISMP